MTSPPTAPLPVGGPTTEHQRFAVLDVLRGFALLGIALANFPEFGLWTFLSKEAQGMLPTADVDHVVRFLQYFLVDGKFYTIFSLLFGIGFSLILVRHGRRLFVRRMLILVGIGALHLLFIWNGDILLLYALGGLLLTLFVGLSDRTLLWVAAALILLPVGLDALTEFRGVDFAGPFYDLWWHVAENQGITEENFASWLRDADSYPEMFAFLQQGACERIWEFVEGHRLPKVLGLFILGYLIGKHKLYARIRELSQEKNEIPGSAADSNTHSSDGVMQRILWWTCVPAVVLSALYAWSATQGHPWGLTAHSLLYALSVIPLAVCYVIALALWLDRHAQALWSSALAFAGRMALTCYLSQSLLGILLFYGVGFGLGTQLGLVYIELIAVGVFLLEVLLCRLWLSRFRFGPLEWLWRLLTYGRYFPIRKDR